MEEVIKIDGVEKIEQIEKVRVRQFVKRNIYLQNDSNLILLQITIPPVEVCYTFLNDAKNCNLSNAINFSIQIPSEETIPIDTEEVVKEEPIEPEDTEEENETQPLDELRSQSLSYAVIVEDRKEDEQKSYHAPVRIFYLRYVFRRLVDESDNYVQSRSGASPTPSGSSVSSPPSPHEPRLDISEHTRVTDFFN